jgi:NADPH:quinone reductase-like Zn-dependent oxidoreductase
MSLNFHEIEIKSTFSPDSSQAYIFSGTILSSQKYSINFLPGASVICYIPSTSFLLKDPSDSQIALISEDFLIPKPPELGHDASILLLKSYFKSLNALHYSLSVLQGESIFILDPPDVTSIHLAVALGLIVYYSAKEDYRSKGLKIFEYPSGLLIETGGLGVNHVLDFGSTHSWADKKNVIDCLGIKGKWAVCDESLQIDPPESRLLFMRNACVCFFNENTWLNDGVEHGKFLHLLNTALKYMKEGSDLRKG